jgi:hypothetical protein
MAYDSLDRAINAAFNIAERQFEPLEIRGSEGALRQSKRTEPSYYSLCGIDKARRAPNILSRRDALLV